MKVRTLAVLGVLAALLALYLALVEGRAHHERGGGRRLLAGLRPERIVRLRISGPQRSTVDLRRTGETWRLAEPKARADAAQVKSMLARLEFASYIRRLPSGELGRMTGLARPRLELTLYAKQGERRVRRLRFGRRDVSRRAVYVAIGSSAYLVPRSLLESVDLRRDQLRDRTLVGLRPDGVIRVRVRHGETSFALERGGKKQGASRWLVRRQGRALYADPVRASQLVRGVGSLVARRFAEGHSRPEGRELAVETQAGKTVRIVVGSACPGRPLEHRVAVARPGDREQRWTRACVDEEQLRPLSLDGDELLDRRLIHLRAAQLSRIRVQRGKKSFGLHRVDGSWRFDHGGAVDQQAVRRWIDALAEARGELRASEDPKADLAPPRARIRLEPEPHVRGGVKTLTVGAARGGLFNVRRGEEQAVLRLDAKLSRKLLPSADALSAKQPR